jgi:hypothetical protein
MTAIEAVPASVGATNPWTQGSLETLPLAFDFTPNLGTDTIASAGTTLTVVNTGATYPAGLSGTPSIVGKVVTQTVTALLPGTEYRLTIHVTTTASLGWEITLLIQCTT